MRKRSGVVLIAALLLVTAFVGACLSRKSALHPAGVPRAYREPAPVLTAGTLLAERGVARMPIVISPDAKPDIEKTAKELADYLSRASGAQFEVSRGDGSRGIVVGTAEQFDPGPDAPALAIQNTYDGREAFMIRSEPNRVLLIGATPRGVPHAVFTFLDALGFRWFFPAKEWEVVPDLPVLRSDIHVASRPKFFVRNLSVGFGFFDPQAKADFDAWSRHNRMGESLTVRNGHSWEAIIAKNRAAFKEHPEYFGLSEGKRKLYTKLCVSNPDVQRIVIEYALTVFRQQPNVDMVSMEPSDGPGHCECDRCKAIGPPSSQPWFLANLVAKELEKRMPGKLVGMLAYSDHVEPPPFPLEPNVFVQITTAFLWGKYDFGELTQLWPKAVKYVGYYDYFSVYPSDWDQLPGGHGANAKYLSSEIHFFGARGGVAVTAESGNNWGPTGRGYYLTSRLLWNPDVDVRAVLDDFYTKAFHAAAPAMRRFYERFDPGNGVLMAYDLLGSGYADVAEASKLAAGDPVVEQRLDQIKQYLHYVFDSYSIKRATDPDAKKRIALDSLTESYRTRRTYMNHWRAIWTQTTPAMAKTYSEPSWNRATAGPHPWRVEGAPSHAETEKRFEAELAALPRRPSVAKAAFSEQLVKVRRDAGALDRTAEAYSQLGPARFALFSEGGEPLEVTIRPGLVWPYSLKRPAHWTIADAQNRTVAEGRLPLDYKEHTLVQPVGAPGVYYLHFDDSGAGYKLKVPAGHIATLDLTGQHPSLGTINRYYFYVPKRTSQVVYYWAGYPHNVVGPDGKVVKTVNEREGMVSIPVPEGFDGQVWSLQGLRVGRLQFFTVPNYVATDRDALLVPADVARADVLLPVPLSGAGSAAAPSASAPASVVSH